MLLKKKKKQFPVVIVNKIIEEIQIGIKISYISRVMKELDTIFELI